MLVFSKDSLYRDSGEISFVSLPVFIVELVEFKTYRLLILCLVVPYYYLVVSPYVLYCT